MKKLLANWFTIDKFGNYRYNNENERKEEEMVDLHCHILPNVDDGSFSMEETIEILKQASSAGFDTICFTPHYAEPQYIRNKKENLEVLERVKEELAQEKIEMNLFLGNEVFLQDKMPELLENEVISSLADTQYFLMELPMYQELPEEIVQKMIVSLQEKGLKVVVAHPERYLYIQKNPNKLPEYFGENVIFQGNYASIIGGYGREAQKTIKKLLKEKKIHYFATDTHHANNGIYENMQGILKKMSKIVDEKYLEILTQTNPSAVIENKEIEENL